MLIRLVTALVMMFVAAAPSARDSAAGPTTVAQPRDSTARSGEGLVCIGFEDNGSTQTATFEIHNVLPNGGTFSFTCGDYQRAYDCAVDDPNDEYIGVDGYAYRSVTWSVNTGYGYGWMQFFAGPFKLAVDTDGAALDHDFDYWYDCPTAYRKMQR